MQLDADEVALMDALREESEPIAMTNFFVERPCCCLSMGYCTLIILTLYTIRTGLVSLSDFSPRDFLDWEDPIVVHYDQSNAAKTDIGTLREEYEGLKVAQSDDKSVNFTQPLRTKPSFFILTSLIFENLEADDYGLLRKDNLLKIREVENSLINFKNYEKFCLAQSDSNSSCSETLGRGAKGSGLDLFKLMDPDKDLKDMT